jgi:hypothetical protein
MSHQIALPSVNKLVPNDKISPLSKPTEHYEKQKRQALKKLFFSLAPHTTITPDEERRVIE